MMSCIVNLCWQWVDNGEVSMSIKPFFLYILYL